MPESIDHISPDVLKRNLEGVQARIAAAAQRAGRDPQSITLVGVTKYAGIEPTRELIKLGVRHIGESRVQDAERKVKGLGADVNGIDIHLIGHLQTNKADKAVKIFKTVHSVDSHRVAEALNKEAAKRPVPQLRSLLEVNVAGEESKFGLKPDAAEIAGLLQACATLASLNIVGLMTMAPYADDPEPVARPVFKRLRELRDELNTRAVYPRPLTELSMGMTQDFEIAIEEGATIVRVGSALFEN